MTITPRDSKTMTGPVDLVTNQLTIDELFKNRISVESPHADSRSGSSQ